MITMSFIETLRNSRSTKVSILHQFLTNYDPSGSRYYFFVEGEPDRCFYRTKFGDYIPSTEKIFVYNCEGKRNVYSAFREVHARYPKIGRALFFVDKDVDDIIGKQWPSDPRIFTTEVYSIENYVAVKEAFERYLQDHIKLKKVAFDMIVIVDKFLEEQPKFYRMILPIMAWIVAMRRSGCSINLNDIDLGNLFEIKDGTIRRRSRRSAVEYLMKVTQATSTCHWRVIRRTASELARLPPKSYIRGKFEAWWFVAFLNDICRSLSEVAKQGGGSISRATTLSNGNLVQLLAASTPTNPSLAAFAEFHCRDILPVSDRVARHQEKKRWWRRS